MDDRTRRALRTACATGDVEQVRAHLAAGVSPDEPLDETGTTPLMAAATLGVFDLLLRAGASPTTGRFDRDTLQTVISEDIGLADLGARVAAARRLLGRGVLLDLRTRHGWSRLYVAAFAGDASAVDVLLTLGAPADDDPPPLAAACWGSGPDPRRPRASWTVLSPRAPTPIGATRPGGHCFTPPPCPTRTASVTRRATGPIWWPSARCCATASIRM